VEETAGQPAVMRSRGGVATEGLAVVN